MKEPTFDPASLISDCRDVGNQHFAIRDFARAEEAFTLGLTMYEMYGCSQSQTAGYGCLVGLADCLRAQARDDEADELIRNSRLRLRKSA